MRDGSVRLLVSVDLGPQGFERLASFTELDVAGAPGGWSIHRDAPGGNPIPYPPTRPHDEDVERALHDAEILITSKLPSDLPIRAPNLRWIHLTSTGVDTGWQPFLEAGAYLLTNSRGTHAIPIAEFVLAGMLSFVRDLPRLEAAKAARRWEKYVVGELHGRTALVLGTGSIGTAIARRANAFGVAVTGLRRRPVGPAPSGFCRIVGRDALLAEAACSDYLVNTMPLTPETRGLVDAAVFDAMRPDALIVNVGRGGSIDGKAMRAALAEGRIGGAILDVYDEEPLPADDPLWSLPNVLLSPHMSAISDVRDARMIDIFVDHVARYLSQEPFDNLVDINSRY